MSTSPSDPPAPKRAASRRTHRCVRRAALPIALLVAAACGGPDPSEFVFAQAAARELTAEDAAQLLANSTWQEAFEEQALFLANLWIDYTLLGEAVAQDTALLQLPLDPVVDDYLEQAMVQALRDSVIAAEGRITEAELSRRYAAEAEGSELRARQIRIDIPATASAEERDEALERLQAFRRQILDATESFESLAESHSEDPMSAPSGGDLGYFGPGDMVPEFYEAVQALDVGEVSEPIETEYGYHLVRLEDRRTPAREAFAERVRRLRRDSVLAAYLDRLTDDAEFEIRPGAVAFARRWADAPGEEPTNNLRDTVVWFRGGAVTVADLVKYLARLTREQRAEIATAPRQQVIREVLLPLAERRALVAQASREGLGPTPEQVASTAAAMRSGLLRTARELGLVAGGTGAGPDIGSTVKDALARMVRGEIPIATLGPAGQALRTSYPSGLDPAWIGLVVNRLRELRGAEDQ